MSERPVPPASLDNRHPVQSTADLFDNVGEMFQSLALQLLDLGGTPRFSGRVRTVKCFEDNALVKSILSSDGAGSVLVVDGAGSLRSALMGDIIAGLAVDNGWEGVVLNGVIRDRVAISSLGLGVKALGSNPRKSAKLGTGVVDTEVVFGGVVFRPGAMLYSDEDGILVERS